MQLRGPQYGPGVRQWQARNHEFPGLGIPENANPLIPAMGNGRHLHGHAGRSFLFQAGHRQLPFPE